MDAQKLRDLIQKGRVYDLGMDYFVGMPHHPNHPPFAFTLTKVHGDIVYPEGVSAANCLFTTGGHTGTHLDSHAHISKDGRVYGVGDITPWQDYRGLKKAGIDHVSPMIARGILLDIAGMEGVSCLEKDYAIGPEQLEKAADLQKTAIEKGDVVLIRTGWIRHFYEPQKYISHEEGCPGLAADGARRLAEIGVVLVGSDTVALEKTPAPTLPVHVILLVENGIHIIEVMNLEELAADKVYQFLFMVSPLKIRGGTASPVRPVAMV